ncbi:hypothetical protein CVT24_006917 [Panaeolus cyanescens]|uniref:Arrestin-like N-terminal domain-containing protein n=1 Tax=Panaeolus cyanescens TaxID=181874 RepID=A0A409VK68_9AGAR|nr:hypothetical protein CVT24_006917 [Panaeolus cyanescens]
MSEEPSSNNSSSRLSRILQRSSLVLGGMSTRRSLLPIQQQRISTLSVGTTHTALPLYSETSPSDSQSMSFYVGSPISQSDDHTMAAPSYSEATRPRSKSSPIVLQHDNETGPTTTSTFQRVDNYSFPVKTSNSAKPWVTLHLYSPKANVRPALPRVYGGQQFNGLVEFNIEKSTTIHEIKLQVKGRIIMGANVDSHHTFLSHTFPVWHKTLGDPRRPRNNSSGDSDNFDGKFLGFYEFPLSLPFPTEVNRTSDHLVPTGGLVPYPLTGHLPPTTPSDFPLNFHNPVSTQTSTLVSSEVNRFGTLLPPSFLENKITVTVQYEANLLVTHGRFRSETKITAGIAFVPTVTPPPLPLERRLVYEAARGSDQGVIIPGPIADPAGWFALPSRTLNGFVSDTQKPVKLECELYIAQPLSYARSSFLPCFLSISSDDSRVLDALCVPSSPQVQLIRKLKHPTHDAADNSQHNTQILSIGVYDCVSIAVLPGVQHVTITTQAAKAMWWKPPKNVEQSAFRRSMAGEIHFPKGLIPSSSCSFFSVEYFVEMTNFNHPSFVFEDKGEAGVIVSKLVEIASTPASEGPIPVPFIRPHRTTSNTPIESANA